MQSLDSKTREIILKFQKNEITEHFIYKKLARFAKDAHNREILEKISEEELHHYHILKKYSGTDLKPSAWKGWLYISVSAVFGVTFGIKLMERGEDNAQISYSKILNNIPEVEEILKQESEHEDQLIGMIDEDKLRYMGSVVLGLNDALVEFTGALAGFTFALQNSRLIGLVGLIMGLSASFSMAASEYLSTKTEAESRSPFKAAFYTGAAYILTVILLVAPYFILQSHYFSLLATLGLATLLILIFTFYFSVVKDISFRGRFMEMFIISMGVASISFIIGLVVRKFMHVDV